jgi:hypothetical protein
MIPSRRAQGQRSTCDTSSELIALFAPIAPARICWAREAETPGSSARGRASSLARRGIATAK